MYAKSFITFINASVLKMVMPKKKKVTKAAAKASIKRLHKASKSKERPDVQTIQPIATREIPPQPVQEVAEVKEVPIVEPEVKEEAVEEEPEKEEAPEEEEKEEKHKKIVIGDALEFGWNSVKSHLGFFIGIFLLFAALSFMSFYATGFGTRIVLGLLILGINLGYFKLVNDIADGKSPEFKELFSCFSLLPQYFLSRILYALVVTIGLVLFIIPGVIWAVQFGFYPFVIVKERLWPLKALRKSSAITEGAKGKLIVFALALIGINLLGLIALGVGIIITIPLSFIAVAHVFKQLETNT